MKAYILPALILVLYISRVENAIKPGFKPSQLLMQDYIKALSLSYLFFEAQRSGPLPINNRIQWRRSSAMNDSGQNGEDLTGGYYDASDYVKFSFTTAFTTTMLAWGVISYKEAYERAGQYNISLEAIKWATDYFIKSHVSPNELYGQVGNFDTDHQFWGRPEDLNMSRPAYKIDEKHPGSDLASEVSAALAATSILFKQINEAYSQLCLKHATELFNFAIHYKGFYNDPIPGAKKYYESPNYTDDVTWAAIWLNKATDSSEYLQKAIQYYSDFGLDKVPKQFYYNNKTAGIQVLLAGLTKQKHYLDSVKSFCDFSIYRQKHTPLGLVYIDKFGTLSHAANIGFICLQAADMGISEIQYANFARKQLNYILGSTGRSFMVGFGHKYPVFPYHAASSCPSAPHQCNWDNYYSKSPNPQVLYGAVVSGPDENDLYKDVRDEYVYNEVSIDYNAGVTSLLAGIINRDMKSKQKT